MVYAIKKLIPARAALIAAVAILLLCSCATTHAAQPAKPAKQSVTIKADRFEGDLDAEILSVSGGTVIETEGLRITGDKLELNRKTNMARLSGSPARAYAAARGKDSGADAPDLKTAAWKLDSGGFPGTKIADFAKAAERAQGAPEISSVIAAISISADIDRGLITADGGCSLLRAEGGAVMFAQTGRATAKVSAEGGDSERGSRLLWAESRENAKIFYAAAGAGAGKRDEFIISAGRFRYDAETALFEASGTARIEFEDGELAAESLVGNLPKGEGSTRGGGKLALRGTVSGKVGALSLFAGEISVALEDAKSREAREKAAARSAEEKKKADADKDDEEPRAARSATVTAGRVDIDLQRRNAELRGGVSLETSDGNKFSASGGWIEFGDDLASVKKIRMENVRIQYNMESGALAPAGGKP
jgi:lipopolysaccharide export system protein LptA